MGLFVNEKIYEYIKGVEEYIDYRDEILEQEFEAMVAMMKILQGINKPKESETQTNNSGIKYSISSSSSQDKYNEKIFLKLMKRLRAENNISEMLEVLDSNKNPSFVEVMLYHIDEKGYRDAEVYKAAQVDKRLFSKMICDREYKPSKDTAIAIAFALKLDYLEAIDLLNRAGYTLSHSNKRDLIIEYFFREEIYDLIDINCVLHKLGQKIIGRS